MLEKIMEIVRDQLGLVDVKLDTLALNHSGIDPLDCIDIVMRIEEEFKIDISEEDAEKLHTVNDINEYVKSKVPIEDLIRVKCLVCEKEFDYPKSEEESKEEIKCPHCKALLTKEDEETKENTPKEKVKEATPEEKVQVTNDPIPEDIKEDQKNIKIDPKLVKINDEATVEDEKEKDKEEEKPKEEVAPVEEPKEEVKPEEKPKEKEEK